MVSYLYNYSSMFDNENSMCIFLEYTFDDILTTSHTSESEISTGWSQ